MEMRKYTFIINNTVLFFKRSNSNTKIMEILKSVVQYCHSNGNNFLLVRKCVNYFWCFCTFTPFFSLLRTINFAPKLWLMRKVVQKCPPLPVVSIS